MKRDEELVLMKGAHVLGEAAIRAGCRYYFGYPITPQNEVPEYMSQRLPEVGGTFLQSESELAAINMVIGASMAGGRVMTSSSSPGISLMQEGLSYIAGQELPVVVSDMIRGGPGLGNVAPAQSDYFQATRGGGHGDYRQIVLAPASIQELADLTYEAFDLADKYRMAVMLLGDGMVSQMMEPVRLPAMRDLSELPKKDWILDGAEGRPSRIVRSLYLDLGVLEEHNWKLARKYEIIEREEVRYEQFLTEDANMLVVAFGTAARIAKGAVKRARREGLPVGLFRPITLWPFPKEELKELSRRIHNILVFEFNAGQMAEDVQAAVCDQAEVISYARPGGTVPTAMEVARVITGQYYQREIH